jgi:aspartate kinase
VTAAREPTRVVKFGGTSLEDEGRVRRAARRVAALARAGEGVVVVVSAMSRTTDRLLGLVADVARGGGTPAARERDRVLATGEDLSAALLAAALTSVGIPARSLRGGEGGVTAEGEHGAGEIRRADPRPLLTLLAEGVVPVVAGFQGVRWDGETVTLARGGSDTSAVAVAASLGVPCDIVTDVAAVYDRDPRAHPDARPFASLTHDELLALAESGAKVVALEAARFAAERGVPLRVYGWNEPVAGPLGGTTVRKPRNVERAGGKPEPLEAAL